MSVLCLIPLRIEEGFLDIRDLGVARRIDIERRVEDVADLGRLLLADCAKVLPSLDASIVNSLFTRVERGGLLESWRAVFPRPDLLVGRCALWRDLVRGTEFVLSGRGGLVRCGLSRGCGCRVRGGWGLRRVDLSLLFST